MNLAVIAILPWGKRKDVLAFSRYYWGGKITEENLFLGKGTQL